MPNVPKLHDIGGVLNGCAVAPYLRALNCVLVQKVTGSHIFSGDAGQWYRAVGSSQPKITRRNH